MHYTLLAIIKSLILSVLPITLIYFINTNWYRLLVQEDGIVEYMTAFALLAGSMVVIFKLIKVKRLRGHWWLLFNVVVALGLFFGFGEEISWGQRIFSIESNEFFSENNLQNEINIHNLELNGIKINKVVFSYGLSIVFGFYFLFTLVLYLQVAIFENIVDKLGIPIPKWYHSTIFIVLSIIIFMIPDHKKWEIWEYLFAMTLLLILIEPHNIKERIPLSEDRTNIL